MNLTPGDHIVAKRRGSWLAASMMHHGIYLGDGTVIHFTGMTPNEAQVIRTNIRAFCGTDKLFQADYSSYKPTIYDGYRYRSEFNEYNNAPEIPVQKTIELCFESLGKNGGGYHAGRNNCEHFATLMKKQIPFSVQALIFGTAGETSLHGSGISNYLIEYFRFKVNPLLSKKAEYEYIGTSYETSEFYYNERYSNPYVVPPTFFIKNKNEEDWYTIDQKEVEYPLKEIQHYYKNRYTQEIVPVPINE